MAVRSVDSGFGSRVPAAAGGSCATPSAGHLVCDAAYDATGTRNAYHLAFAEQAPLPPPPLLRDTGTVPQFDVNAACGTLQGDAYRNGCVATEQESYDALKATWTSFAEPIRAKCLSLRAVIGQQQIRKYSALKECAFNYQSVQDEYDRLHGHHQFDPSR